MKNPEFFENELVEVSKRLTRVQKALVEREKRLKYFMEEGVSDIIVRKALTSVQEAQVEIERLEERQRILRAKWAVKGGISLN